MINEEMFLHMKEFDSVKSRITFEISSWIGRKFYKNRSRIPLAQSPVLLDLGAGTNYTTNWIHADFYSSLNPIKRILKKNSSGINVPEVQLDLRYPLFCPNDSIDGIYTSHTIEHLLPHEAVNLLKEIYRVLKPDMWLRIVVPDLQIGIEYYCGKNTKYDFSTGCEAIMHLTQNWGHKSAWDERFLSQVLEMVGFINVKKVEYGIAGSDVRLIKETDSKEYESLVIEAQKPGKKNIKLPVSNA